MKSKTLKVTGIIMIIGGVLGALISLLGLAGGALMGLAETEVAGAAVVGGLLLYASAVMLISALVQLVAGILGVKYCDKPEKAGTCVVMGGIVIGLCVLSSILSLAGGGSVGNMVVGLVLSFAVPVLYTYGALQLKKSGQTGQ